MSTQLRLVEPPEPAAARRRATAAPARARSARVQPARSRSATDATRVAATATGRRVVQWGEWRLDARTRKVGRAGVARARQALEQATVDQLSQAS